jgi:dihydroorotase
MHGESTILLQQVRIIDPVTERDFIADVLITNNRLQAIQAKITNYSSDTQIVQGNDLILGTGLVDLYSHSGEPGNEARETLYSLASSAAAGGFMQVAVLPDTLPSIDNQETLTALQQKVIQLRSNSQQPLSQLHFWTALALDSETKKMSELGELSQHTIGFTQQLSFTDLVLFKQALEYLKPLQKPIAIDVSRNQLTNNGTIREGADSIRYGLVGNPDYAETTAIAAILEIIASLDTPVHIMKVSTARGVELIADAKQRGVPVTASTTWMHLLFSTQDQNKYNPNLRLEPPLGNLSDVKALQDGVRSGIIDAIAINHQAYTYEEKTVPFAQAPPGVIGLELALPILWQKLVTTKILTPTQLWQALSLKPSLYLQQPTPNINSGSDIANLVLFDTEKTWQVNQQNIQSQGANTPWWNQEITGKVLRWNFFNGSRL